MSKIAKSLREAILASGLKSGMTISFHHHLRNGDRVMNLVLDEIAALGIRDLTVNASAVMDVHAPLLEHIRSGVVTGLETAYIGAKVGRELSRGVLARPVVFRTHGSRASEIAAGRSRIDLAFIAASGVDEQGGCTGRTGPAAFGGMGYAIADAQHAKHRIAVTDTLLAGELAQPSIPAGQIDQIVRVDQIGDAEGIVSSTTQITKSPLRLKIARDTARIIEAAGLLKDGLRFQTGAGGVSLAAAKFLREKMQKAGVQGDFCLGGITGYMVEMLHEGRFARLLDMQCFDRAAIASLEQDPAHIEISGEAYASPAGHSYVDELDAVILGATEIDLGFNVNVHTDSYGRIMGGSGGHSDAAAGAKLTIIAAPLLRGRIPLVREKVTAVTTPGRAIDVLVTECGVAVNPQKPELRAALEAAGLPLAEINEQYQRTLALAGRPAAIPQSERVAARIIGRDGSLLDELRCLP